MKIHLLQIVAPMFAVVFGCAPPRIETGSYEPPYPNEPRHYRKNCAYEAKHRLFFPLKGAGYATLKEKNSLHTRSFSAAETQDLIQILNDTASYQWGEVGTFILDYWIEFYDDRDSLTGVTKVDIGAGQTYSEPHLAKMKWGYLTDAVRERFLKIVNKK